MSIQAGDTYKGQAVYTPFFLKIYNLFVVQFSNYWLWRCDKKVQLEQYNKYMGSKHLDIGVGTGYYLQQCNQLKKTDLALMDLNPHCLEESQRNLKEKSISLTTYHADIYQPQPQLYGHFNSIAMNYLLHCLPGTLREKGTCIANAVAMLNNGGIFFGATILGSKGLHTKAGYALLNVYNNKGIFCNREDNLEDLKHILTQNLDEVEITVQGCVALFKGCKRYQE